MRFRSYEILVYFKLEARSFCTVKIASPTTWSKATYPLARSCFNQWSRVQFPAGSQKIVNLFGAGYAS